MPAPDSYFLEAEFTAGVWTDISTYMDGGVGASVTYGRSTQYGPPQAATLTVTLENTDGRFTPLRQTLKDLVTVHPYYPNLVPRKRIRWGYVKAAVRYVRFTGYVRGWPTGMVNDGSYEQVTLTAVDRSLQLQRYTMKGPIFDGINSSAFRQNLFTYWPLTDSAGATSAAEAYGGAAQGGGAYGPLVSDGDVAVVFGATGPGVSNGTAATFTAASASSGSSLTSTTAWNSAVNAGGMTLIIWVNRTSLPGWIQTIATAENKTGDLSAVLAISAAGQLTYTDSVGTVNTGVTTSTNVWTMLAVSVNQTGSTLTVWKNGVSVGTLAAGSFRQLADGAVNFRIGAGLISGGNTWAGQLAHVAMFAFDASSILPGLFTASTGGVGEVTSARIARWLGYAGLAAGSYNLDTSTVTLSAYDQFGKTPFDASQDIIDSEGPGAAVYVDTDDRVRFVTRDKLKPLAPVLTIDAAADLDVVTGTWDTAYDADNLVNSSVGSRADNTGTLTTQLVADSASSTAYGVQSGDFTSYAQVNADVLGNAQARVTAGKTPGFRLNRVTVDLSTASNDLWATAAAVRIGDRIRITNMPAGAAPTSKLDLIVQGWTDTFTQDGGYLVAFDTIPADTPAWFVWDDATYGRWQSGVVLNADITAAATSLTISGTPTFTTDPTMYPMTIVIDVEHITLNSAHVAGVFSGVTRGADGTAGAAHTGGTAVDLVPTSTWTL
jgi:hypothetical protein